MANKTIYLPISAPEDYLPSLMETFARSVGWTDSVPVSAMEYSASYIRKLILNNIAQQSSKEAAEIASKNAEDAIKALLLSVEQEAVAPIE